MDTNRQEVRYLIIFLTILAGIASIFFLVKSINELKASRYIGPSGADANIINVSGEGEAFAVPDTASFHFTVRDEAGTVSEAQQNVTETQNNILGFLKGEGIDEENIKTTGYNIFPRYEYRNETRREFYPPEGRRVLVGYEVRHTIEVKVEETERAGELLSGVGELGVDEVSGISFTIDDEDEIQKEARQKAIEDARQKAEGLANDLNIDLGRLVSFSESGPGGPVFMERAYSAEDSVAGLGGGSPEIPAGENKVVVRVNLGYEIR